MDGPGLRGCLLDPNLFTITVDDKGRPAKTGGDEFEFKVAIDGPETPETT